MYFNAFFNLTEVTDSADYAVFDDIAGGFKFFNNYKGWLGCQHEFTLTDKYKGKRKFKWGKPTIMCMNEDPASLSDVDYEWLQLNCIIVEIGSNYPIVSNVRANT